MARSPLVDRYDGDGADSLICTEDEALCYFDDDDHFVADKYGRGEYCDDEPSRRLMSIDSIDWKMEKETEHMPLKTDFNSTPAPFTMMSKDCIDWLLERETEHRFETKYLQRVRSEPELRFRREAFDWISKVHSNHTFKPSTLWLSMNYLDRFLSYTNLSDSYEDKAWVRQILSLACLSIAMKLEETNPPKPHKLQQVGEVVFTPDAIQRMELTVLTTLEWKMKSPTPFSFVEYFISNIIDHHHHHHYPELNKVVDTSVQLILNTIKGVEFLEFKPSEIAFAAAATIIATTANKPLEFDQAVVSFTPHLHKDRVIKCMELMKDLSTGGGFLLSHDEESESESSRMVGVVQSPTGVLDINCFSSSSSMAHY